MVSIKKTGLKTTTATMLDSLSISSTCSSSEPATSATNSRGRRTGRTNDCKKIPIRQQNRARTMLAVLASLTILNQLTSNEGSQQLVEASSSTAVKCK